MEEENLIITFEHEFGRLLSPIELEIINDWKKDGFDESKIREALKQSIYNGALSLKYISKILQSWKTEEEISKKVDDLDWLK